MKDKMRQIEEMVELKKGKEVKPNLEDNHLIHYKIIVEFAKTSEFLALSDDIKRVIWLHAENHKALLIVTLKNDPILASYAMNLGYANESDMQVISQVIALATAQEQGDALAAQRSASSQQAPSNVEQDTAGKIQAISGVGPQVAALQNPGGEQNG